MIWVSCEGESPADIENLGPINYSPRRGFPAYYFPFKNVKGYQPPIVAVQFENPKRKCEFCLIIINLESHTDEEERNHKHEISHMLKTFRTHLFRKRKNLTCFTFSTFSHTAGVLINIECKAWAKNIKHDRAERRGSVHFELMID